jgi:uncharacterized protein
MVWEMFRDKKNEWRFRLRAVNNKILLQSEGYKSKKGAKNGIESITRHVFSEIIEKK